MIRQADQLPRNSLQDRPGKGYFSQGESENGARTPTELHDNSRTHPYISAAIHDLPMRYRRLRVP